ncbi:exodeoxyribonuclease VII large subunit [Pseudomonas duriflava]|uniref:Exodeoxyribonuclease VII large subunit n=1 Tax=Pseudomonas duriflava TaxID=459528 RepID=A0A562PJL8_9PSED|nr:exodeoxyribonuclease VII large subunit [Pseudomonas duriflava]TWI44617.1 exodeoxyribonuclease VII large subunit [Pseudomonas duriflava]
MHNYQERYLAQLPSAVAEEEQCLGNLLTQYTYLAERKAADAAQELMQARQALSLQLGARLAEEQRCVDALAGQYQFAAQAGLQQEEASLQRYKDLYAVLDPRAIMAKGFALVRRQDGQAVRSVLEVTSGDRLEISFHEGNKTAIVQ